MSQSSQLQNTPSTSRNELEAWFAYLDRRWVIHSERKRSGEPRLRGRGTCAVGILQFEAGMSSWTCQQNFHVEMPSQQLDTQVWTGSEDDWGWRNKAVGTGRCPGERSTKWKKRSCVQASRNCISWPSRTSLQRKWRLVHPKAERKQRQVML